MSYSSNNQSQTHQNSDIKHSDPIPIGPPNPGHRRRSASLSLSSSSTSSGSPPSPLVQTPLSFNAPRIPSPTSSPILSYFLAQSPTKTSATFPFKRNFGGAPPVFEEEEQDVEVPVAAHARRATTAVAGRFSQQQQTAAVPDTQRGSGLLRRLSLGNTFSRVPGQASSQSPPRPPSPPPNTAVNSTPMSSFPDPPLRKARRATLAPETVSTRPRRAPSPMGERILKGHFDGFN